MKALADIKRRQLSTTVVAPLLPNEDFDYQQRSFGRSSRHGLHAVSPVESVVPSNSVRVDDEFSQDACNKQIMVSNVPTTMVIRPTFANTVKSPMTTPKLTTDDFIQVKLVTVRESTRHCYWPSDVVARFAAADVIR